MKNETLTATQTTCYHCGEDCDRDLVFHDDKPFCCTGCKMVYEILNDHELNTYYCLEDQPGTSFKKYPSATRFDYLEDPELIDRIVDFRGGGLANVRLYIPNIHCTSCVWLLENLYKLEKGVKKSSVNFLKRELSLTFDENDTSLRRIAEILTSIGYEPEMRFEKLDKKEGSSPNRRLWLQMGVAGFAFGNIMLFSFPEYLSGSTLGHGSSFAVFFGILNIALAIPVLFYSAQDYLKSAWAAIKQGGINLDVPISIGILALFTRSVYEIVAGVGAGYMDSLTGLVFFLLIGRMIQKKTFERLSFDRDYKSYLPLSVTVLDKDDVEKSLSINRLKEGARMLLRNSELVPADSVLISETCFVDYSFITGESEPVEVIRGETVYAGGKIIGNSATMSTTKEVSNSYLTRLWNDAAFDGGQKPVVSSLADRISPHFTLAVIGIAVTSGLLWLPAGFEMSLTVFTAVLIIACPCALALSTPFTLGSALNIFSFNGLYIKGIEAIERLSNTTSLVFDKTGTLTKADEATVRFTGETLNDEEEALIKSACKQSVHPLSRKIAANLNGHSPVAIDHFEEAMNKGITAHSGKFEVVIGSDDLAAEYSSAPFQAESQPMNGTSIANVVINGNYRGRFEITSRNRDGISGLLNRIGSRFKTFLLSGDNESQKDRFSTYFDEDSLRFRQTPKQKLDFVRNLQKRDEVVVMVGDGLNDAGALQQSDFGVALTDNLSSFTPACDAILDGASLGKLDRFIHFSESAITVIKLSFGLSLLYNVVGLSFAVAGQLSPLVAAILMPLSSITIMVFTTVSTHLAAKRRGLDLWK